MFFCIALPLQTVFSDVRIETSFRRKKIGFDVGLNNVLGGKYQLKARIFDGKKEVKEFTSPIITLPASKQTRTSFSDLWLAPKLWDLNSPQNLYSLQLSLLSETGKVLDILPAQEFGFREFWAKGRHFYLNGTKIHLRSLCMTAVRAGADKNCKRPVKADC